MGLGRGRARPERAGALLLCACDERASEPGDDAVDPAIETLLRDKLASAWAGQRTFAPDGRFVIG